MKVGFRKPSIKKSIKARTTGKLKRKVKKTFIPGYGKKGMGWIKDPKRAAYNKVYNKTTFGVSDLASIGKKKRSSKGGAEALGCLWYLFFAWWILPIKWVCYSIPKAIFDAMRRGGTPPTQEAPAAEESHAHHTPAEPQKIERHKVAGTSFRLAELQPLGVENDDYELTRRGMIDAGLIGERVYKTDYFANKVELIPEPENPHDHNAIRVVVDGVHIGYIKAGSCAHIHNLIREDKIETVKCEIEGGRYKILLEDYDEDGKETYELEKDEAPIHAELFIKIK